MWNLNYRSIHLVAGSFILKCCKKLLKNVKSVLRPFISLKQFKHKRPRVFDVQLVSPHGFNSIHRYTLTNWLYTNITHDYFIHATGSSISLYNLFLSYASSRKVHRMTPNDLDMFNVKNTNMHAKCTPKTQIFARFALRWAVFELRKSAPKTPDGLDMLKVKNTPPPPSHPTPTLGPKFRPFALRWAILSTSQFLEQCTERPQMTLICSRSKIQTLILHTPLRLKFSSILLYDRQFLTCSKSKVHIWIPHISLRPNFLSASLYDEPYSRKLRFFNSPLVTM